MTYGSSTMVIQNENTFTMMHHNANFEGNLNFIARGLLRESTFFPSFCYENPNYFGNCWDMTYGPLIEIVQHKITFPMMYYKTDFEEKKISLMEVTKHESAILKIGGSFKSQLVWNAYLSFSNSL